MRALSSELARADLTSLVVAISSGIADGGEGGSCIAGAGESAAGADVAMGDPVSPDRARLQ